MDTFIPKLYDEFEVEEVVKQIEQIFNIMSQENMDSNNNDMTKINNRNNNGIGETLFWKVFSNVYLLNYIIKKIHTTEWVLYDDHKEINKNNRYKFKDIYSLDWMIEYKQYQLFKCKIESGDYIHFNKEDIEFIFKKFSTLSKDDSEPDLKPEEIEKNKIDKQEQLESLLSTFKLLMEKKRLQFEICDLTKLAVSYNCLDALTILTSEPYSIIVYPSTLELAISKCSISIVKLLLSLNQPSCNLVTDEIKIISLKLATQNIFYRNEMVEFILDNPNLYQLPLVPSKKDDFIIFKDFSKLKSFTVKSKLMEMIPRDEMGSRFSIFKDLRILNTFEEMLIGTRIFFKYGNITPTRDTSKPVDDGIPLPLKEGIDKIIKQYGNKKKNSDVKLKELVKLLIIHLKPILTQKLYNEYILKYQESIDEYHNDGYRLDDYNKKNGAKLLSLFRYMGINGFNGFNNQEYYKSHLQVCMDKIKIQRIEYYPLLDLIERKNDGGSKMFILNINNQTVLDWLIKCDFTLVNSFIQRHTLVEFSTIKLWNYAFEKRIRLTKSKSITDASLTKCFNQAIKEADIDTLVLLEPHFKEFHRDITKIQLPNNETKIHMVINHLIKTNYPLPFIYEVFKVALTNVPTISFSNVKIDFKLNLMEESTTFLFNSILALDFKITEIFINNIDSILLKDVQLNEFIFDEKELFDSDICVYHHFDYDVTELVSIVGKLMNKFNQREKLKEESKNQLEIHSYEAIFNYYFQILIQIEFIALDKVLSLYKLLVNNSFVIEHSLFHSFFYLQIRDPKLTKYILSRPGYKEFFDVQQVNVYSAATDYIDIFGEQEYDRYNGFNLSKHLNVNQFTFDYILGGEGDGSEGNTRIYLHSFDEILIKLVNQLSINLVSTEDQITEDFFTESLNEDLIYFLTIKRIDLFFSHLDYISSKLQESIEPDFEEDFPLKCEIYDSPSTELLATSTLFQHCSSKPKLYLSPGEEWKDSLIIPCTKYVNAFKFSNQVIDLVVNQMNIQDLHRFIEFNFHVCQFHDKIFKRSIWWSRFENASFILDNYNIEIFSLPLYPVKAHYNYQGEFKFITENYFHKVSNPSQFIFVSESFINRSYPHIFINQLIHHLSNSKNEKDFNQFISSSSSQQQLVIDKLVVELYEVKTMEIDEFLDFDKKKQLEVMVSENIEIQLFIKSKLDTFIQSKSQVNGTESLYIEQDDNLFNESFIQGDITMCNLILNSYPSMFKITTKSIKNLIENGNIHCIKYFYNQDNCKNLINNFQSDQELLQYLKDQLSIHPDYKFDLNWL